MLSWREEVGYGRYSHWERTCFSKGHLSFKRDSTHFWQINSHLFHHLASTVALVVKNRLANAGDTRDAGTIPVSGRSSRDVQYLGWNRSPAQVGCMRQALGPDALGKPRGSGWRGRWEGGSGWGTHVNPWLLHSNIWQNSLQIKKIKKKKKKENGNPLQDSCQGNPMDRRAWCATVHGVRKESDTTERLTTCSTTSHLFALCKMNMPNKLMI